MDSHRRPGSRRRSLINHNMTRAATDLFKRPPSLLNNSPRPRLPDDTRLTGLARVVDVALGTGFGVCSHDRPGDGLELVARFLSTLGPAVTSAQLGSDVSAARGGFALRGCHVSCHSAEFHSAGV